MRRRIAAAIVTVLVLGGSGCSAGDDKTDGGNKPTASASANSTGMHYDRQLLDGLNREGFKKAGEPNTGKYTSPLLSQPWEATLGDERVTILVEDDGEMAYAAQVTYDGDFRANGKKYDKLRCVHDSSRFAHVVHLTVQGLMIDTEAIRARMVAGTIETTYSEAKKVDEVDLRENLGIICYPFE